MISTGWRTLVVDRPDQLYLHEGSVQLQKGQDEYSVPIDQVRQLMVTGGTGFISLGLLNRLMAQHASVILCDSHHQPSGMLMPADLHSDAAGRLMDQASWTDRRKEAVWRKLVRMKINNQIQLLKLKRKNLPAKMEKLKDEVVGDDEGNREAVAAKMYFRALFGKQFSRNAKDETNAALNYGYAIIMSAVSRCIALHGFSTALGIHHCSRANRFNLSCDIMQAFRPFVDRIVSSNPDRQLDWSYKTEIINVLHEQCQWAGERTTIADAIEGLVLQVLEAMQEPRRKIREVSFAE